MRGMSSSAPSRSSLVKRYAHRFDNALPTMDHEAKMQFKHKDYQRKLMAKTVRGFAPLLNKTDASRLPQQKSWHISNILQGGG